MTGLMGSPRCSCVATRVNWDADAKAYFVREENGSVARR